MIRQRDARYAQVILAVLIADIGVSLSAVFVRFSGAPSSGHCMRRPDDGGQCDV